MNFQKSIFNQIGLLLLLMFAIIVMLPSCEWEDDDDDDDYEEHEEEEYGKVSSTATLTLSTSSQLIPVEDRENILVLGVAEMPLEIRKFLASETPASQLEKLTTFNTANGTVYFEVELSGNKKLLFNANAEFICLE